MGFTPDDYDVEADFSETGMVTCNDCGTRVRPRHLDSLPPHDCVQRREHNEKIRLLDVGQPSSARTHWVPLKFRTKRETD